MLGCANTRGFLTPRPLPARLYRMHQPQSSLLVDLLLDFEVLFTCCLSQEALPVSPRLRGLLLL